jgi:4-hydroxyacetophenone monooxygenase
MKREHSALPITEDDAAIREALESASIPTLMMSLIHLTGDAGLLDGPIRPGRAIMGDVQAGLSDEQKAEVRKQALEVLRAYRDGGCKLPPPPSPDTIRRMLSFMVGETVPDEYVPMFLEEMELDGEDVRALDWSAVPEARKRAFHVLVIGAGMSGVLAAIRLEEAGIAYTVVEKNPTVGGTWYENRYPGCRVDVANHFYCYSFEPSHDWSEFFSRRDEIQAYFERTADRHAVRENIRFETEVVAGR